ncbi:MAG: hypothetical protein AAF772_19585 [Acidobacteriota bacterium]
MSALHDERRRRVETRKAEDRVARRQLRLGCLATLILQLIVIAIWYMPEFRSMSEIRRQRLTAHAMRAAGQAWLRCSLAHAPDRMRPPAGHYDLADLPHVFDAAGLMARVPQCALRLPATDGWGHPLRYHAASADGLTGADGRRLAIRSAGRDGTFETFDPSPDRVPITAYREDRFDSDLIWADGAFVRWPDGVAR